jgi:hypothetical protein
MKTDPSVSTPSTSQRKSRMRRHRASSDREGLPDNAARPDGEIFAPFFTLLAGMIHLNHR